MAFGLRLHHTNAGAPPDANGLFCVTCHPGDPAPPPETTTPPGYLFSSVLVKMPCSGGPPPGEDFNGDGVGLDNDGNLLYDGRDTACITVPNRKTTWGQIKALFEK